MTDKERKREGGGEIGRKRAQNFQLFFIRSYCSPASVLTHFNWLLIFFHLRVLNRIWNDLFSVCHLVFTMYFTLNCEQYCYFHRMWPFNLLKRRIRCLKFMRIKSHLTVFYVHLIQSITHIIWFGVRNSEMYSIIT